MLRTAAAARRPVAPEAFTYSHTQATTPFPVIDRFDDLYHYANLYDITAAAYLFEVLSRNLAPLAASGNLIAGHEYALVVTGRRFDNNPSGATINTSTTGSSLFAITDTGTATPVPEPSSLAVVAIATGGIVAAHRRRRGRRQQEQ